MGSLGRMWTDLKILWPPNSSHDEVFLEVQNIGIDEHMPETEIGEVETR